MFSQLVNLLVMKQQKSFTVHDEINGIYKKIVFQENKMIGAVLFGDTRDGSKLLNLIVEKKDIPDSEKNMLS